MFLGRVFLCTIRSGFIANIHGDKYVFDKDIMFGFRCCRCSMLERSPLYSVFYNKIPAKQTLLNPNLSKYIFVNVLF